MQARRGDFAVILHCFVVSEDEWHQPADEQSMSLLGRVMCLQPSPSLSVSSVMRLKQSACRSRPRNNHSAGVMTGGNCRLSH